MLETGFYYGTANISEKHTSKNAMNRKLGQ